MLKEDDLASGSVNKGPREMSKSVMHTYVKVLSSVIEGMRRNHTFE